MGATTMPNAYVQLIMDLHVMPECKYSSKSGWPHCVAVYAGLYMAAASTPKLAADTQIRSLSLQESNVDCLFSVVAPACLISNVLVP